MLWWPYEQWTSMWSLDQQHQQHLEIYEKGQFLGPTMDLLNEKLRGKSPAIWVLIKPSRRFGCIRNCRNITAAQMLGREMSVVCHRGELEMAWWSQHQERTTPAEGVPGRSWEPPQSLGEMNPPVGSYLASLHGRAFVSVSVSSTTAKCMSPLYTALHLNFLNLFWDKVEDI